MAIVTEERFRDGLQTKLGASWERVLVVFRAYGPRLSHDVTNVLLHAIDKEKVDEVLGILDDYYQGHLKFQHPEIRGTVCDRLLGVNPTEAMFLRLYRETLRLLPNPA